MATTWPAIIIVHTLAGRHLAVRVGRDLIYDTDPVIVSIDGVEYPVRETKQEIETIIREAV